MINIDPIFEISNGLTTIDFLDKNSGFYLDDPYWQPKVAVLKGGGTKANPSLAKGKTLVHGEEDNVIETIPLTVTGHNQAATIRQVRILLKLLKQAENYWIENWERDDVWLKVKPACNSCLPGYARIVSGNLASLSNPFGQPFFSSNPNAQMTDLVLVIEREPFWRGTEPGTIIGPLFNLIKNSDFELWGNEDGDDIIPNNWSKTETLWIAGLISRDDDFVKFGQSSIKINVSGSTLSGASRGISQVLSNVKNNTEYTVLAWVRSEGVSNGVGRILITYQSQLELYRESTRHGYTLYTGKITTGSNDVVAINCQILTTLANTDGTIYIDSLMFVEGDWVTEAVNGILPWIGSSHITNKWDQESSGVSSPTINYLDVWNVPGDIEANVRLEIQNNTSPIDVSDPAEVIEFIRVGQRRQGDIFQFSNYHDPEGLGGSNNSGGDHVEISPIESPWRSITTKIIQSPKVQHNLGRFKVFARVWDDAASGDPTLNARLVYFQGEGGINVKRLPEITLRARRNWTIADLTKIKSMVQDFKFKPDLPSQIGWTLQFNRAIGSDAGHVDYMINIPTDGGYIEALIAPPLRQGDAFVVDNTASSMIGGSHGSSSDQRFILEAPSAPCSAIVYKEKLYMGCTDGELIEYFQGAQRQVGDYGANAINALVVYNGLLHISSGLDIYTSNGDSFSAASPDITLTQGTEITAMSVFNNDIFIGASGGNAPIFRWDGSALNLDFETQETDVLSMTILNNRIYIGTSGATGSVYRYSSEFDNWKLSSTLPGTTRVDSLNTFKFRLFAGCDAGKLFRSGGTIWEEVFDFDSEFSGPTTIQAIVSDEEQLYVGGTPSTPIRFTTTKKPDLKKEWSTFGNGESIVTKVMIIYNGMLIIGQSGSVPSVAIQSVEFKTSEFRGSTFTSIPLKRHRYFFLYDRKDNLNNVADKILVGIGFVPRYLTLVGDGVI